jgi:hypothetical protein
MRKFYFIIFQYATQMLNAFISDLIDGKIEISQCLYEIIEIKTKRRFVLLYSFVMYNLDILRLYRQFDCWKG